MVGSSFLDDDCEMVNNRSRGMVLEDILCLSQKTDGTIILYNNARKKGLFLIVSVQSTLEAIVLDLTVVILVRIGIWLHLPLGYAEADVCAA